VAAEHAASAAVARRLSSVFQAAGAPHSPVVVVGLPPGSRHELGAFAFAATLRRRGLGVLYVGADVTVDGWVDAATRTRARGAVIGVVTQADRPAAAEVVVALHAVGIRLLAVGGQAAEPDPAPGNGVLVLPPRIADAAGVIAKALARRR
jgi:methylmalonyl-CoA mutase cobalamin-binding subunit